MVSMKEKFIVKKKGISVVVNPEFIPETTDVDEIISYFDIKKYKENAKIVLGQGNQQQVVTWIHHWILRTCQFKSIAGSLDIFTLSVQCESGIVAHDVELGNFQVLDKVPDGFQTC